MSFHRIYEPVARSACISRGRRSRRNRDAPNDSSLARRAPDLAPRGGVVKCAGSVAKRGRPSIRTFVLVLGAALTVLAPGLALSAPPDPVILLLEGQRREIQPSIRAEVELLPLDLVISGFGVVVHSDARAGAVTLTYQGREASFYNKKSLASVGGDLRLLSSPAVLEDGQWLVPVDAVPRVIGPLLGKRAEWRAVPRVLTPRRRSHTQAWASRRSSRVTWSGWFSRPARRSPSTSCRTRAA